MSGVLAMASALAALLLASGCAPPPELPRARPSHALAPARTGPLAAVERAWRQRVGDDRSGFLLLDWNDEALRWRLSLIDSATTSLDLQYYLWYGDASGRLLALAALRAADRGVRVRILVDDLIYVDKERNLAALDAHPNLELRLFNPWQDRSGGMIGRALEFMAKTDRLNSRMHNKLIVADGRLAICGGRNLGDQYFGLDHHSNFHDLDVLAVGPAARKLGEVFDVYWNATPVVSAGALAAAGSEQLARRREVIAEMVHAAPELASLPREQADWSVELGALAPRLHAGTARLVYDVPGETEIADGSSAAGVWEAVEAAREEILVENAYWVPTDASIELLHEFARRGVRVLVVTNSLASHDVPAVNSGYKKWRKAILESGVELYELRHDAAVKARQDTPPVESEFLGLHSKTFVVDREVAYVGSHNLDPRSREINTELGLLIRSRGLAEEIAQRIEGDAASDNSWRVEIDAGGKLVWHAGEMRVTRQPARSGWQRFQDAVFGVLPIDDQL